MFGSDKDLYSQYVSLRSDVDEIKRRLEKIPCQVGVVNALDPNKTFTGGVYVDLADVIDALVEHCNLQYHEGTKDRIAPPETE